MKKFKKMLPYLIINAIVFYLTPFMIKDTGSGMLILLIGFPSYMFYSSFDLRDKKLI